MIVFSWSYCYCHHLQLHFPTHTIFADLPPLNVIFPMAINCSTQVYLSFPNHGTFCASIWTLRRKEIAIDHIYNNYYNRSPKLKFGIWYEDVLVFIPNLVDILLCVGVVRFEEIFLKCNLLRTLLGNEKKKKLGLVKENNIQMLFRKGLELHGSKVRLPRM